jgi:hypothetical protein
LRDRLADPRTGTGNDRNLTIKTKIFGAIHGSLLG